MEKSFQMPSKNGAWLILDPQPTQLEAYALKMLWTQTQTLNGNQRVLAVGALHVSTV